MYVQFEHICCEKKVKDSLKTPIRTMEQLAIQQPHMCSAWSNAQQTIQYSKVTAYARTHTHAHWRLRYIYAHTYLITHTHTYTFGRRISLSLVCIQSQHHTNSHLCTYNRFNSNSYSATAHKNTANSRETKSNTTKNEKEKLKEKARDCKKKLET